VSREEVATAAPGCAGAPWPAPGKIENTGEIDRSRGCRIAPPPPVLRAWKRKEAPMTYVDGFVLAVPKDKLDAYKTLARTAGEVWKEYGALDYVECIADDVPYGELTSFPRAVQAKEDEVVVFSWITYQSREQRDAVNKQVMADPRLKDSMTNTPFDGKRMIYGGFQTMLAM
jgi:uncharacterized protein YbaA (DUF1428 family)